MFPRIGWWWVRQEQFFERRLMFGPSGAIYTLNRIDMSVIDILGDQEETLGTAEDLREEIVVDVARQEVSGSSVKVEFETSAGLCSGHYFSSELGHEEIILEPGSVEILQVLYPSFNGVFLHPGNRDWVEISLSEHITGLPEYKIYNRIVLG
ncbi:hypothetical protein [Dyadobacter bucti]|uniref:hypothetical protein n=1 Tax=Dyadobacter bucti TaxID=2572203 RepID=UPI003F6F3829